MGARDGGAAGVAGGAEGAAGAEPGPAVVFLHLRFRHVRRLRGLRQLQPQLRGAGERHRHRRVRVPLPAEPGGVPALADSPVQPHLAQGRSPARRLLGRRPRLRGRGRGRLPLQPGRAGHLPGLPAPVQVCGLPAAHHGPAGLGARGRPVARGLLGLGPGPGARPGGGGRAPPPLPHPLRALRARRGHPHGRPGGIGGLRLPQPPALGRRLLVRLQGDAAAPPGPAPRARPRPHVTTPLPPPHCRIRGVGEGRGGRGGVSASLGRGRVEVWATSLGRGWGWSRGGVGLGWVLGWS